MISGFLSKEPEKHSNFLPQIFYSPDYLSSNHSFLNFGRFSISVYLSKQLPVSIKDVFFQSKEAGLIVLLSGRIFNEEEISQLLLQKTKKRQPELIAEAFKIWGAEFVEKLNGDFAIAIWVEQSQELFLFRDHLGIQPLSYILKDASFFFSTDTLNLCKYFSPGTKINIDFLLSFKKYVDNQATPNPEVKKLFPGHYLIFSKGKVTSKKYWTPEGIRGKKEVSFTQAVFELRELLEDSIRIRSDKQFYAGSHLSGGLDSGVVSAISRKFFENQHEFYGFSWSPKFFNKKDNLLDERDNVQKTANYCQINPVFLKTSKEDYLKSSKDIFYFQNFFQEDLTRKNALNNGVNLIFSGWGGDEFLSKGDGGIDVDLLRNFRLGLFFKRNPIYKPKKLFRTLVNKIILPVMGLMSFSGHLFQKRRVRYIRKPFKKNHQNEFRNNFQYFSRRHQHLSYLYSYRFAERCEMWAIQGFKQGIVYRYPLLDKRIIEYLIQVPSEILANQEGSRVLIKEICKSYLPEEIILNSSKMDNSLYYEMNDKLTELFPIYKSILNEWKENKELFFIDFEILEKDINNQKKMNEKQLELLYYDMFFINNLHEFTKTYRSLPDPAESDQFSIDQV